MGERHEEDRAGWVAWHSRGKMEPTSGLEPLTCGRLRRLTRFGVRGGFAARVGGVYGADERARTADLWATASPDSVWGSRRLRGSGGAWVNGADERTRTADLWAAGVAWLGLGCAEASRLGWGGSMEPTSGLEPLTCGRLRRLTRFGVRGGFAARVGVGCMEPTSGLEPLTCSLRDSDDPSE